MARKKSTKPADVTLSEGVKPQPFVAAAPSQRPGLVEHRFPTIALVGRPNVGKSSLFNALLKEPISITDARAGTTRDRVLHPIELGGKPCELLDTGGIGIVDKQNLSRLVEDQIDAAISTATIFALVVDAKDGLTPHDRQISQRLRALGRPIVLVINKTEGLEAKQCIGEFARLGYTDSVATAANHRLGLHDLEDLLAKHIPESDAKDSVAEFDGLPKIAIVGRRNVGKSSFVNVLAREERTIVSDVAGTTRDAVDLMLEKDNQKFCLIDTAGIRRMKEPEGPVEFYAQVRTERAIQRADVIMLMLEAKEGVSTTDQKTAALIEEAYKPCVLVVNKWDQSGKDLSTEEYAEYVTNRLTGLRNAPICFTSAVQGQRCWQTIDVALELQKLARIEVPTPRLNKALEEAERRHEPPVKKSHKPKMLYGVQVAKAPPTFVIYCRWHEYIDDKYKRFLSRFLREKLEIVEVPVRIFFRKAPR